VAASRLDEGISRVSRSEAILGCEVMMLLEAGYFGITLTDLDKTQMMEGLNFRRFHMGNEE